ncbi:MAG: IS4 family transposase [Verrucomicrobia bacterium]|nr:IS4 family transposase [Verrucomicrobiota bacterium]
MPNLFASASARSDAAGKLLQLFVRLLALHDLPEWPPECQQATCKSTKAQSTKTKRTFAEKPQRQRGFYWRAWSLQLTLWYLIWQRLSPLHTLVAAVADARRGGADALCGGRTPLSQKLRSSATAGLAKARKRLPLPWLVQSFERHAQALAELAAAPEAHALPVRLLDGSTQRLRPHGDIPQHFPPHRTRRQQAYWCVARTVVCFCAATGMALLGQIGSLHLSEQALAVRMLLRAATRALYVGDRNFGVWRVAAACAQSGAHALVRLTRSRAGRLAGGHRLKPGLDWAVNWAPTRHDQVDRGLQPTAVVGRLVVVRATRPGWRTEGLYLFTTLADPTVYPPAWLLAQYGRRWQVELNLRWVKATMELGQLEVKSAAMARKEFYAGLMAYNLVRGLMGVAAHTTGVPVQRLSFATARTLLCGALSLLWLSWVPATRRWEDLQRVCAEVGRARLPRRRKRRPSEPRAQYHVPQVFPPLQGTRAQARRNLKKQVAKR